MKKYMLAALLLFTVNYAFGETVTFKNNSTDVTITLIKEGYYFLYMKEDKSISITVPAESEVTIPPGQSIQVNVPPVPSGSPEGLLFSAVGAISVYTKNSSDLEQSFSIKQQNCSSWTGEPGKSSPGLQFSLAISSDGTTVAKAICSKL